MNSSLSPTSMLLFEHTDYRKGLVEHAEKVAEQIRNGETEYDFLAFDVYKDLEYPLQRPVRHPDVLRIKKTLQKQAQRAKKRSTPVPYIRSQRSMCFIRAKAWLEVYNYPFFHRPDGTMVRRWIDEDGKERIGSRRRSVLDKYHRDEMGSAVVGYKKKKAKRVKDRKDYYPVVVKEIEPWQMERSTVEQPELEFVKPWCEGLVDVENSSLTTPVTEPTPVAFDNHAPRYTQPANAYPKEEKLVRTIFKKPR